MSLRDVANKVSKDIPEGWIISLQIEKGAAWVECCDPDGRRVPLPDSTDKSLREQLYDALDTTMKEGD